MHRRKNKVRCFKIRQVVTTQAIIPLDLRQAMYINTYEIDGKQIPTSIQEALSLPDVASSLLTKHGIPTHIDYHVLLFNDDTCLPQCVGASYIDTFNPQPGGYYLIYDDGWESYSTKPTK